jgi:hypothetical protein
MVLWFNCSNVQLLYPSFENQLKNQTPNALLSTEIWLSQSSWLLDISSSSAKSVIIKATSPVNSSFAIKNSKYSSRSLSSSSSHLNLIDSFSFLDITLAACSVSSHMKIKFGPLICTSSANHSERPLGVVNLNKAILALYL